MSPNAILVFCAQALLAQSAFSACAGGIGSYGLGGYNGLAGGYGAGLGYSGGLAGGYGAGLTSGYGSGCGCGNAGVASTGGGLPVSSVSPIAPVGVSVMSENAYEGQLCAGGNLPFLGSVGIEGVLPTAGTGAVSYGCGDGLIGVGSEGPIYTGVATPGAIFPPGSPSAAATNAVMVLGNGLGGNAGYGQGGIGYGMGSAGYGMGSAGYGMGGAGCGMGGAGYGMGGAGYGMGGAGYGMGGAGYGLGGRGCGCGC